jgi:hypothetical protein
MGTLERRETLTHHLGSAGRLSVKTVTGVLRIRGIEGEEAHVTVAYRIRATDHASAERALDSGRVLIDRGTNSLDIETPERRLATGLAWLFGGARVNADIMVEVPYGTAVKLETMSGSIEAENLVGEQHYRTISGEIRLWGLAGAVEAGSISGGVTLDTASSLRLRANSISGGIKARAARFYGLSLNTTSGSMIVYGGLDPSADHRIETIAGGIDLTPLSGVTAELRTVSGSIRGEMASHVEGTRGSWRAVVGDGQAHLWINSTSGSLRLLAPSSPPGAVPTPPWAPAGPSVPAAPAAPSAPVAPSAPEAPTPASPGPEQPEPAPTESWEEESAEEGARLDAADKAADEELAVLRALERGEIGVDEAAARLDRDEE